ncbi:hypothetical protein F5B22DRAFT_594240 [Xylaria bambusicola]|uniref:uncharacterized protein n=1 Tax=Xylaria bambusicola TaxID=326684 RepID=UPI00200776F7|nr:uncharacterized protein F5B22DRAFT_594240 [Xylaria bambusicola]KAI0521832.1 hypothetical protein F5B22DRAFT_594240 [Xylaria bambusicola]
MCIGVSRNLHYLREKKALHTGWEVKKKISSILCGLPGHARGGNAKHGTFPSGENGTVFCMRDIRRQETRQGASDRSNNNHNALVPVSVTRDIETGCMLRSYVYSHGWSLAIYSGVTYPSVPLIFNALIAMLSLVDFDPALFSTPISFSFPFPLLIPESDVLFVYGMTLHLA